MDKFSERKIEEVLQTFAEIRPGTESINRMQEKVQSRIADRCRSDRQMFLRKHRRLIPALAAAVLIAAGLIAFFRPTPPVPPPVRSQTQGPSTFSPLSVLSLNSAYQTGGMEAVEKIFEQVAKLKKPRPEIKSIDDAVNGQSEKEK